MLISSFFRRLTSTGLLLLSVPVLAQTQAHDLVSVCGQPGLTIKEEVKIGQARRVSFHQQTFLQVDGQGDQPTLELMAAELKQLGVKEDCAEYFLSLGQPDEASGRVYFNFDRADLTPASKVVLQSLLDQIRGKNSHILLAGHTDSTGTSDYNFSLGMQRAEAVSDYLAEHQVAPDNIDTVSYGESEPLAANTSAQGRRLNRRVDIFVGDEDQPLNDE